MNLVRQQHAVAKHIAAHVADPHHSKRLRLDILVLFPEVTLHAFPGTPCGNAHLLVVVTGTASRGKRIAQPEAVFICQAVGNIREGRGALVRRHYQIGVIAVVAHHLFRRHNRVAFAIISEVQQATDELLVAGNTLLLPRLPISRCAAFHHKTALGPHRHNNGVLDHLRLDQAQHLGAEILTPVGPAQAATGHRPTTQVNAFHGG